MAHVTPDGRLCRTRIFTAKRTFDANVNVEINRIMAKECMKYEPKYPKFYAEIERYKDKKRKGKKKDIKDEDIRFFNCPMDIIYKLIDEHVIDLRKNKPLNIYTTSLVSQFVKYDANKINVNRSQYKKVLGIVKEYCNTIEELNKEEESYDDERMDAFNICMNKLKNLTIKTDTMKTLVAFAFQRGNEKIRDRLLVVLYDKNKEEFLECFHKKIAKN